MVLVQIGSLDSTLSLPIFPEQFSDTITLLLLLIESSMHSEFQVIKWLASRGAAVPAGLKRRMLTAQVILGLAEFLIQNPLFFLSRGVHKNVWNIMYLYCMCVCVGYWGVYKDVCLTHVLCSTLQ